MTDRDRSNVRTLANLDVEEAPEPYVYMTKAKKRVTFPDPGELDAFEAEELLFELGSPTTRSKDVLQRWLTEADFKALVAEKFTYRQMIALVSDVQKHYESIFGTAGESDASES